ncbi:DUF1376 domain-containing protein [Sphingomonas sp.]|uniref:YdaU family protein n=1 Tax=Sphingomonas sp. TaxID=28214 RepID=UPI00307DF20F
MTDKANVWMPLYIGDYLRDTQRLSTVAHGAYLLLIMDYWMNGAPPDDDAVLATITRMTPDAWSMHRALLERFFSIEDGCWKHRRVEAERAKAAENSNRRKSKAKAAAEARWGSRNDAESNAPSMPEALPEAMPDQCPSPSPSPIDEEDVGIARAPARTRGSTDIIAFTDRVARAAGVRHVDPGPVMAAQALVTEWRNLGASDDEIIETVRRIQRDAHEPIRSLRFFDAAVRQTVAKRENQPHATCTDPDRSPRKRTGSRAQEMDDAVDRFHARNRERGTS